MNRDELHETAPKRQLPRPFSFHWGGGQIVEEATFPSEHHEPTIQLLEYEDGSLSVRFCSYNHRGMFQRNPMMLSREDVPGLRASLEECPRLKAFLQNLVLD